MCLSATWPVAFMIVNPSIICSGAVPVKRESQEPCACIPCARYRNASSALLRAKTVQGSGCTSPEGNALLQQRMQLGHLRALGYVTLTFSDRTLAGISVRVQKIHLNLYQYT